MSFFNKIKEALYNEYDIDAFNETYISLKNKITNLNNDRLQKSFEIEEYIYNFHFNIDYMELYNNKKNNYIFYQIGVEKGEDLLEFQYSINPYCILLYINKVDKQMVLLKDKIPDRSELIPFVFSFSFNKDWGYSSFILTNLDLALIDIFKNGTSFYGYEFRDALKEILIGKTRVEINATAMSLLKKFSLKFNALNLKTDNANTK